ARIHSQWRCIYDKIDILKLCTQCCFVPRHCFEARCGAEHAWSGKERPQPLRERLRFFVSTIHEDKTFTILERALPGNGMTRAAACTENQYTQIAHIDREFGADSSEESFAIGI